MNAMQALTVDKVVVHMGVGESGERLSKAEDLLRRITGQSPVKTFARRTIPAFGIKKGAPIGCKVTLRGKKAEAFVQTALDIVKRRISSLQFDSQGNFSFGIEEHTDFPGMIYDPKIGIFGMDVSVCLERRGARVTRRAIERRRLPSCQRVTPQDAITFLRERYRVEVV
ncbi:MAG: 50S ribosomal protein L5 [Methanomicrobiales archaeon]|nr:50S ribosomal protein L5 [Methanomicrobiales archaeon]